MAKVMIQFTKDEFHYLAALVGLEIEEWQNAGDCEKLKRLGSLRGRLISSCLNDSEVVING